MAKKLCIDCGAICAGTRCPDCQRPLERRHHNRAYDNPAWRRLSGWILASHRAKVGDWCPGDERHEGHACTDLTVDHVIPLAAGGELLDRENTRVLCREWNGRKGSRVLGGVGG